MSAIVLIIILMCKFGDLMATEDWIFMISPIVIIGTVLASILDTIFTIPFSIRIIFLLTVLISLICLVLLRLKHKK